MKFGALLNGGYRHLRADDGSAREIGDRAKDAAVNRLGEHGSRYNKAHAHQDDGNRDQSETHSSPPMGSFVPLPFRAARDSTPEEWQAKFLGLAAL